jgi:CRISPR/Cas system CSM-associated protein Csm4 (group 5 of RAMP superfamily)
MAAIAESVEKDRREKQGKTKAANAKQTENQDIMSDKKLSDNPKHEHADKTATKTAELFNTNRTYVNNAVKQWYLTRHSKKRVCQQTLFFHTATCPFARMNFIAKLMNVKGTPDRYVRT